MTNTDKAQFLVSDDRFDLESDYQYRRVTLYVPIYAVSLVTHKNGKAVDYNLHIAKRELINKVLSDLLETEDWYEEDQDRHQGLASGTGGND